MLLSASVARFVQQKCEGVKKPDLQNGYPDPLSECQLMVDAMSKTIKGHEQEAIIRRCQRIKSLKSMVRNSREFIL